ncbi:MAG TPA: GGDEF domain-containing protein [Gaiellaceae bacterium]|nr:GGDEF domain-containing protein [Gaiellaceae bacterium]
MDSRPTTPDDVPDPTPDPFRLIAEVVRAMLPAEQADALLERVGTALERQPTPDWDRLALENAQMQHELELLASTDRLTGLRNRQRFFEDLRREFAAARRYEDELSVLLLDVDGLSRVNAADGYRAGDELLVAVGETLLRGLRVSDIAARLGDDDFAVILPRTGREGAEVVAERLAASVGAPVVIGVAALDGSATSGADLLERADRDLAERKRTLGTPPVAAG